MEISIHANMCDTNTQKITEIIHPVIKELGRKISGCYGGILEHLWIDIELVESYCREDGLPKYPFRFQKRVSGKAPFGLPSQPDSFNVGHFSVRPDFEHIQNLNGNELNSYFVNLIYQSLEILNNKKSKIGNIDVEKLKNKYKLISQEIGIEIY